MLRIIYYISAIILLSGCVNKSIKSGDGANTASIADINASIRVDFSKGVKNKIIYQPFSSFVNDSSVHIILGFLFSALVLKNICYERYTLMEIQMYIEINPKI